MEATEHELLGKKDGRQELAPGCLPAEGGGSALSGCGRGRPRTQMMDQLGCDKVRRIVRAPVEVLFWKMRGPVVAQNGGTPQISPSTR